MKIGLDWSGVIADVFSARRLVLMEMYGGYKGDTGKKMPLFGPYHDPESLIVPFSKEYYELMKNVHFGRYPIFTHESARDWALRDKSDKEEGTLLSLSLEEYEAMKIVLYEREAYALNIPEIPGALEGIKKLAEAGHAVTIVTSRGPGVPQSVVKAWLAGHNVNVPVRFGVKDKTKVLAEYDFFVDDKKVQLAPKDKSLTTVRSLFLHSYNAGDSGLFCKAPCTWVAGWDHVLSTAEALKENLLVSAE